MTIMTIYYNIWQYIGNILTLTSPCDTVEAIWFDLFVAVKKVDRETHQLVVRDACASKCTCKEVSQRRNHLLQLGCSSARSSMVSAKMDSISMFFSSHKFNRKRKHGFCNNFISSPPPYFLQSKWEASLFLPSPRIFRYYPSFIMKSVILSLSTIYINCCHFHLIILDQGDFNLNFFHFLLTSFNLWPLYWKKFYFFMLFPLISLELEAVGLSNMLTKSGWTF